MKACLIILFLTIYVSVFSQSNWIEVYNANSESLPDKTFYLNEDHAWGIKGGAIHFSDDGGANWNLQYDKPQYSFSDLYFTDELNGWVVGWSEVLHTVNGGESWEYQTLPNPMGLDVNAVYFINPDTGWIAGSYQMIFVTYNGGQNWAVQHQYDLEGHFWLWELTFWDELNGCAVGGKLTEGDTGIIFNTNDGGNNWIVNLPNQSDEFNSVQYINPDTIWAGDIDGYLYLSTNGGINWDSSVHLTGIGGSSLKDFHFFDQESAMAILESWQWAYTNNAWQTYEYGIISYYHRFKYLSFNSLNEGMMTGYGNFWLTLDEAETWNYQNITFGCLDFPNENTGWVGTISPDNKLFHTSNGGVNLQTIVAPDQSPIMSMDFLSEDIGFIGTESGLYKTINGGMEWTNMNLPASIDSIKKFQALNSDTLFALAKENLFLKSFDGGQSWDVSEEFENEYLNDLHFRSGQWGAIVGAYGLTATTQNGGENWDVTIVEEINPVSVWFINNNTGYCISIYDSVYKTIDGGHNWDPIDKKTFRAVEIIFANENTGWIVEGHQISKTKDGGETWEIEFVMPGTDIYKYIMDLSVIDDQTAYFCTSEGKIYKYDFATSIDYSFQNQELICYPNPATNQSEIVINRPLDGNEEFELHKISGESVSGFSFYYRAGKIIIDINKLDRGVYICSIKLDDNSSYTGKLIKQ